MNGFLVFAFLFFIGSCLGWCMELIFRRFFSRNNPGRKWINPGFLVGPYLPLYGFGLAGMFAISIVIQLVLTGNIFADALIIFIIMAIIMTAIEYVAGLIFIKGMKVKLWDYSNEKLNLQGIICPKFSIIWGLLGGIYYFTVNSRVESWVMWLSQHLAFSFFIGMFFGVFIVDLCYTLQLSSKIRSFAVDNELVIKYEELKGAIRAQWDELEGSGSFVLAFKTDGPLKESLERYLEKHTMEIKRKAEEGRRKLEEGKQKLEEVKEDLEKVIDDVKNRVDGYEGRNNRK